LATNLLPFISALTEAYTL